MISREKVTFLSFHDRIGDRKKTEGGEKDDRMYRSRRRRVYGLIPVNENLAFPVKTFAINILGSFIIGLIAGLALKNNALNPRLVLFLKVGICGGFTTFSSFALETGDLIKGGNTVTALLYVILSVAAGVAAVFGGQAVVR